MPTANYFMFLFVLLVLGVDALDRRKCSSHCTLSDKESAGCWNTTLGFFEEVLLDQMRGYVLAQTGIAAWKSSHNQQMNWTDAVSKSVKRMERINPPDIEDEIGITDSSLYESVVKSLITNSKDIFDKNPKVEFVPPCPSGCEVEHETYKKLFIGSMIGSGVLFALILLLSIYNYKRVKKSVKQEAVRALQAYELNLNNKSKQTFKLIDVDI